MNTESIALLGFIQRAKDYLKLELLKNGQSEELKKLENIDIETIKENLINRAGAVFDTDNPKAEELLKAGRDAFDQMIEENRNKNGLIAEFTKLFDSFEVKDKNVKEDLNSILSQYESEPESYISDDDEIYRIITEGSAKASMDEALSIKEVKPVENKTEGLDDVFNEILGAEAKRKEKKNVEVKEVVKEEKKEETRLPNNEEYLRQLAEELKRKITQENAKKPQTEKKVSVFEKISNLYPYLSGGFIRAVYGMKEGIARENPIGGKIILLHRVYFNDVESLRQFVEIVSNHDYTVNVDEDKLLVDVFKEHFNSDGKILTNIFEIANQAKVLGGEYEGYRIVSREEN